MRGSGTTTTLFIYNAMGLLVAEYGGEAEVEEGGTLYLTADHLGSTRVVTSQSQAIKERRDYLPFGEEINPAIAGRNNLPAYGQDVTRQQFTQKERDAETGLDNFGARYYSSSAGRFTSCDPVSATQKHVTNPQRWNLYVYVINNPVALYDPDGRQDEGKGAGKVIDVFLNFPPVERNEGKYEKKINPRTGEPDFKIVRKLEGPDWPGLQQEAREAGYTLRVNSNIIVLTAEGFSAPSRNSDAVIYIGHTSRLSESRELYGIKFPGTGGDVTAQGVTGMTNIGEMGLVGGRVQVSAAAIAIFSCESGDFSGLFDFTGTNQTFTSVNGGRNHGTSIISLEWAGYRFVQTYIRTNGVVTRP